MELEQAIEAIQQPRSRFQLEHFVVRAHDTPEMQFHQVVLELSVAVPNYRIALISKRRQEREIERLKDSDDPDADLDLEEKQITYGQFCAILVGTERELAALMDIYNAVPHFTRTEIDHAQPEYWEKRLNRQAQLSIMSGKIGWADLEALRQIDQLDPLIEEHQKNLDAVAAQELEAT
mgnify:FL=1